MAMLDRRPKGPRRLGEVATSILARVAEQARVTIPNRTRRATPPARGTPGAGGPEQEPPALPVRANLICDPVSCGDRAPVKAPKP